MPTSVDYPGCTACCGGQATDCPQCAAVPLRLTLVVPAGLTNGGNCPNCPSYSGTFVLKYNPVQPCSWGSDEAFSCSPPIGIYGWGVSHNAALSRWELAGASNLLYTLADASFSCLGSNTFTYLSGTCCNGRPATLTTTPA